MYLTVTKRKTYFKRIAFVTSVLNAKSLGINLIQVEEVFNAEKLKLLLTEIKDLN